MYHPCTVGPTGTQIPGYGPTNDLPEIGSRERVIANWMDLSPSIKEVFHKEFLLVDVEDFVLKYALGEASAFTSSLSPLYPVRVVDSFLTIFDYETRLYVPPCVVEYKLLKALGAFRDSHLERFPHPEPEFSGVVGLRLEELRAIERERYDALLEWERAAFRKDIETIRTVSRSAKAALAWRRQTFEVPASVLVSGAVNSVVVHARHVRTRVYNTKRAERHIAWHTAMLAKRAVKRAEARKRKIARVRDAAEALLGLGAYARDICAPAVLQADVVFQSGSPSDAKVKRAARDAAQREAAEKAKAAKRKSTPKSTRERDVKVGRDKRHPVLQSGKFVKPMLFAAAGFLFSKVASVLGKTDKVLDHVNTLLAKLKSIARELKKAMGKILWAVPLVMALFFVCCKFAHMPIVLAAVTAALLTLVGPMLWEQISKFFPTGESAHKPDIELQSGFANPFLSAAPKLLSAVFVFSVFRSSGSTAS